jgi:hypothetical protein
MKPYKIVAANLAKPIFGAKNKRTNLAQLNQSLSISQQVMSATGITEEIVATVLKEKLATEHVVRVLSSPWFFAACPFATPCLLTQGVGF